MGRRATIADVAQAARVSVATVDRVLNGRLPVRTETAERVLAAATDLGYHAAGLMRRRMDQALPRCKFGFILQRPDQLFYQDFARILTATAEEMTTHKIRSTVSFLPSQSPADISATLKELAPKVDALAMVAVDHPAVTAAVAEIEGNGKPVFSLLSDFANGVRHGYVGTNNRKVGRTAGWLIAKAVPKPGKVAVFVGSHRFHGHEMREIGFRSYLREAAPELAIIETQVSLEDDGLAHEAVLELLGRHPDLVAVYVAGGGTEGVIRALREHVTSTKELSVVCNELNSSTHAALAENIVTAVLGTPLQRLAGALLPLMANAVAAPGAEAVGQTFLPFEIHVSENI